MIQPANDSKARFRAGFVLRMDDVCITNNCFNKMKMHPVRKEKICHATDFSIVSASDSSLRASFSMPIAR